MEILRKVKCSDRLPDEGVRVFTKRKTQPYQTGIYYRNKQTWIREIDNRVQLDEEMEYWYEPIEVELDSEKILPKEERLDNARFNELNEVYSNPIKSESYLLLQYHKALEVAELKNMQLISCIPSTFYNNLEPIERLNKLVEIWNRSIKVIDQLQEELREVKGMLDYINKLDEEFRIKQEKDLKKISEHFKFRNPNEEADERYNKALELFKQTYHVTEQEFIDRYPHINNMFKIAAYGK